MPLLTPETSSSSRDSVTILTPSQSLSSTFTSNHRRLRDQATCPDPKTEHTQGRRQAKETVIILGPFEPQTHDLSSSHSSSSSYSHSPDSPQVSINRIRTPIQVPIPRYEDCFEAPWADGFDQVDYEGSNNVMMDGDDQDSISSGSGSGSNLNRDWIPPPSEPDHWQIVKDRLEATASLLSQETAVHCQIRTPAVHRSSKRPRLSTIASSVCSVYAAGQPQETPRQVDDMFGLFTAGEVPKPAGASYTIPQLRGLSLEDDPVEEEDMCEACFDTTNLRSMKKITPCHHDVCGRCFSAAVGSVSQDHPIASCPKCLIHVTGFAKTDSKVRRAVQSALEHPKAEKGPIVMRIDNVAWDLTPEVVQEFLPPGTLSSDTLIPIHIPLDRYDGRTKDYMYIEVASGEAARKILQKCQNTFMPGGPLTSTRKRAVTITQVPHMELLRELRPESARELQALLALCQASVTASPMPMNHTSSFVTPNGVAHFVKNRHGPFNALMSILSKVKGKSSPSYWDLFHVTSGAIAALASNISRLSQSSPGQGCPDLVSTDKAVLDRLASIFESTFGIKLEDGRLSPV